MINDRLLSSLSHGDGALSPDDRAVSARAWVVTFADLAALMLTFFVMLFAMTGVKSDLWRSTVQSLTLSLKPSLAEPTDARAVIRNSPLGDVVMATNLDYLGMVLSETLRSDPVLSGGTIVREHDTLILAFPSRLLFLPAAAELSAAAKQTLTALGGQLRNIGNPVGVNGYASDDDAASGRYGSTWELSLARAAAVARTLTDAGYDRPLVAYGRPLAHQTAARGYGRGEHDAASNRVDIVILPGFGDRR